MRRTMVYSADGLTRLKKGVEAFEGCSSVSVSYEDIQRAGDKTYPDLVLFNSKSGVIESLSDITAVYPSYKRLIDEVGSIEFSTRMLKWLNSREGNSMRNCKIERMDGTAYIAVSDVETEKN